MYWLVNAQEMERGCCIAWRDTVFWQAIHTQHITQAQFMQLCLKHLVPHCFQIVNTVRMGIAISPQNTFTVVITQYFLVPKTGVGTEVTSPKGFPCSSELQGLWNFPRTLLLGNSHFSAFSFQLNLCGWPWRHTEPNEEVQCSIHIRPQIWNRSLKSQDQHACWHVLLPYVGHPGSLTTTLTVAYGCKVCYWFQWNLQSSGY